MIALTWIVPVLVVTIVNLFKYVTGEFHVRQLSLELHVSAISMMAPLPLLRPDLDTALYLIVLISTMTLLVTSACSNGNSNNHRSNHMEKTGVCIGGAFFVIGVVLLSLFSGG